MTTTTSIKDQLVGIVGKENVLDSPEAIARYGSDCSLEPPRPLSCVVKPKNVEETQKVMQLANEAKFAVVPQTSGVHFNGGAVPKVGGVVVDLSRMNRIVDIVDESMVAHLQVGVTWEQFITALEPKGYRSVMPLLPHASRSVIVDWLEREHPVVQNYEYAWPLRSLQMVWGNGEEFVSGSASVGSFRNPGDLADGVLATGPGPMSWDTFLYGAQGTMGMATWGVVSIEYIPTMTKTFFVPSDNLTDLIEPTYRILRRGVCSECLILNNIDLATILTESWPQQFDAVREKLPKWMLIFTSIALERRPEEKIAYQEDFVREMMSTYFSKLQLSTTMPNMPGVEKTLPDMLRKPWPKDRTYWKHAYKGGCQDLTFITTLDRVEKYIGPTIEVATQHGYPASDVGCYLQPIEDGHACQLQFSFFYNPDDQAEVERMRRLYVGAAAAMLERGAYFTRPYPMLAKMVYNKAGDYAELLRRLKKVIDPNSVMSPGNLCF